MAISKERLEELIEQGATIFVNNGQIVYEITLGCFKNIDIINNVLYCGTEIIPLNNIFETKEEAEWFKEFGCIERVERLKLPTWEEINKNFSKERETSFYEDDSHLFFITPFGDIVINNYNHFKVNEIFRKPFTKENYTIACRKAKELFLKGDK